VPNLIRTESERYTAIDTAAFHGRIHEFGAIYQGILERELIKLNVKAEIDPRTNTVRLPAIPDMAVDEFSKRSREGEAAARKRATREGRNWDAMTPIASKWPGGGAPFVVCTGGEPLLQLDAPFVAALHRKGFEIAIETNGTIAPAPSAIDWVCVSPKAGAPLRLLSGDELKLVVPQAGLDPATLERLNFRIFSVQPKDDPNRVENTRIAVEFCLNHPKWRLSIQTHKYLGIR
jgi:organic radical activating enzyme